MDQNHAWKFEAMKTYHPDHHLARPWWQKQRRIPMIMIAKDWFKRHPWGEEFQTNILLISRTMVVTYHPTCHLAICDHITTFPLSPSKQCPWTTNRTAVKRSKIVTCTPHPMVLVRFDPLRCKHWNMPPWEGRDHRTVEDHPSGCKYLGTPISKPRMAIWKGNNQILRGLIY